MIAILILWAFLLNWAAYKKGFYTLPQRAQRAVPSVTTSQLLISFGIYLVIALLLVPFLARLLLGMLKNLNPELGKIPVVYLTGLQFCSMLTIFLLLQFFLRSRDSKLYRFVWKDREHIPSLPIEGDVGLGVLAWFLSFPLVAILGEILDKLLKAYGLDGYEQTAVKFVKTAQGQPFAIFFVLASVLIMAPLIEEYLFRGLLQSYCRKRLGPWPAILLSALSFALFHFAPTQGFGNVPLLLSLLLLGGYLGFLYERQGSLWAPIGLHMTFNAVSALRIFLFPEVV